MAVEEWICMLCHPVIGVECSVIDRKIWKSDRDYYITNYEISKSMDIL